MPNGDLTGSTGSTSETVSSSTTTPEGSGSGSPSTSSNTSSTGSSGEESTSSSEGESSTEGTSGTSSSDGSSSSTSNEDLYEGLYEFCYPGNEFNCTGSLVTECVYGSTPGAEGFCSTPCETADDCPLPLTGNAGVECSDNCGTSVCRIRCGGGTTCPDDSTCRTPFTVLECETQWDYVCLPDQT